GQDGRQPPREYRLTRSRRADHQEIRDNTKRAGLNVRSDCEAGQLDAGPEAPLLTLRGRCFHHAVRRGVGRCPVRHEATGDLNQAGGGAMRTYARWGAIALLIVGLVGITRPSLAGVDEYGKNGTILGVSFTGGDGSYKKAVSQGIVLGIVPDFPWTYQDEKTKEYKGLDVSILKEATRRLGITKVSYQIMPFDSLIAALQAKRIDVIVDNIHENEGRL